MINLLKLQTKVLTITAIFLISISGVLPAQKIAIIDAGSSGSRLYVYEVKKDINKIVVLYPKKEQELESKGKALSSVVNNKDSVTAFLMTMACKYENNDGTIPLYILATAGMRLVEKDSADSMYEKIAENKGNLVEKGYDLKKAMTISGRYEGLYAWIAANYKKGTLSLNGEKKQPSSGTSGILEIGGASMQIAFVPHTQCSDVISHTVFGNIYSKSYLRGGVDQIYNTYKDSTKYKFKVPLKDVSEFYGDTLKFLGQGKPIGIIMERKDKKTFKDYANTLQKDPTDIFHSYMNAQYIAWVVNSLKLEEKLEKPEYTSDWTEGAAIDIVVNEKTPEEFDYTTEN